MTTPCSEQAQRPWTATLEGTLASELQELGYRVVCDVIVVLAVMIPFMGASRGCPIGVNSCQRETLSQLTNCNPLQWRTGHYLLEGEAIEASAESSSRYPIVGKYHEADVAGSASTDGVRSREQSSKRCRLVGGGWCFGDGGSHGGEDVKDGCLAHAEMHRVSSTWV